MKATIWHNPDCGTSRNVLAILQAAGAEPEVIDYRQTGWDEALLRDLLAEAGLTAQDALRVKGTEAEALGLTGDDVTEAVLIAAMLADPLLVNRPLVRTARGTRLCRPSEAVLPLLDRLPAGPLFKEDGTMILDADGIPVDAA